MSTLRVNNMTNVGGTGPTYAPGHVVQVQQAYKRDVFSLAVANTWTDVPGLSVSITPASASSKVIVRAMGFLNGASGTVTALIRLVDGSGNIIGGSTAVGSRSSGIGSFPTSPTDGNSTFVIEFLDLPASTATKTYKLQIAADNTNVIYLNRNRTDVDAWYNPRGVSSITVMEVAA